MVRAPVSGLGPGRGDVRMFFSSFSLLYKLQTLLYDILSSTTAVFSYAIGCRKLSADEQFFFFVGAQTVVGLFQPTRNFFFNPGLMRLMFTCVLGR